MAGASRDSRRAAARRAQGLVGALLGLVLVTIAVLVADPALARRGSASTHTDGAVVAGYKVVFAGYGSVSYRGGPSFTLRPAAPQQPGETHSALVVSTKQFAAGAQYAVRVTTQDQLRAGSAPNPWETGWVVFNYTDPDHFYYLAMKTNGWELGKRDPAYPGGQRFLATGAAPAARVGRANEIAITTSGATLQVRLDGRSVTRFTDRESPYLGGSFGFYAEDAQARFDQIAAS